MQENQNSGYYRIEHNRNVAEEAETIEYIEECDKTILFEMDGEGVRYYKGCAMDEMWDRLKDSDVLIAKLQLEIATRSRRDWEASKDVDKLFAKIDFLEGNRFNTKGERI